MNIRERVLTAVEVEVFDNELVMTKPGPVSELMALLDVRFDECTPTRVSGSIAADESHHQPWGIVRRRATVASGGLPRDLESPAPRLAGLLGMVWRFV